MCYKKIVLASLANYTLSKLFFRGEVGGGGKEGEGGWPPQVSQRNDVLQTSAEISH